MKAAAGVVSESGVVLPEVPERKTVQVPSMGGIAKRAEIRIVGRRDIHVAAGSQQAVELLHCPDYVGDMLDNVDCTHSIERAILERIGEPVEVAEHIGGRAGDAIHSD
jgi:hypothetical protein